ncbi:MAG: glycosyltransferase family 1 protein [Chlorobiaceae bacterium]|nr:glycosyltransferase family 1 protein [Chlorobiaceae bacterium]
MSFSFYKRNHGDRYRLVWFSEIQWDFLSTRKQRLLSRFPENWKILFIEPYAVGRRHHWLPVKRGRVWVVSVPFLKSVPYRIGRLLDNPVLRSLVSLPGILLALCWITLLGFASRKRIIGLSNVYWGRVVAMLPCRLRFYDANDDHLAFPGVPAWLKDYLETWLSKTDLLFSVSPELTARLPVPEDVRCVELGNGVEFGHFATFRPVAPVKLSGIGKPVLGYAGAMDWLDTELVADVARAWPETSIVLLGPAYERGWWQRQSDLKSLPNVHFFGKIDYDELPAWVQRFDLALIPLPGNRLKGVSHPNKLYEYCAAGVPVLTMNYCSAVDRARDVVHVADTRETFVQMLPRALADSRRDERQAFAREYSWDVLARQMVEELTKAYQKSSR